MTPTPLSSSTVTASALPSSSLAALTALDVLRLALRRRRLLLVLPMLVAITVVGVGLLADRQWVSQATFVAQSPGGGISRLAGLAAQFGVNVPNAQSGQSPDFYADVLRGDGMMRRLLAGRYTRVGGQPLDLAAHLVPGVADTARRGELALRQLRTMVSAGVGIKTGLVRLAVRLDDPELARQVAAHALEELNRLNVLAQQAQASQERMFTDTRLSMARDELRVAEDRLENFLRSNRVFSGAPQLVLQEDRLRREVNLRQQVVSGLAQGLEQARLEESRNLPVITVVEAPVRPALPDSRRLVLKALFAAIVSATALLALVLAGEWRRRLALLNPALAAEMELLAAEAARDLRRPWRLMSKARSDDQSRAA
ncbi:hypothetical protein [Gemmatimonas sp.]|uniref:hypothetical protein n=1 Tax=Gemmatimonas sp. TaxID=1962908 RepID=UPI0039833252